MKRVNKRLTAMLGGLAAALLSAGPALADYELNMPPGVTAVSREVYGLHMLILWICVAIGVVVFGAIIYSVIKFRKSKGAVPAQFHHSTTVEIIWTVIPMLILIGMAVPATKVLVNMYDTSDAELTVKITGYQWKWGYEYLDEGISFISTLDRDSNLARQANPSVQPGEVPNYLLEVDEPLVLPVGKKVRFLLTANDVIHSWWVPALGWKKDAIPGFINEAWTLIEEPGIYRGQCAELCGRDHGFMPVVVKAVSEEEYRAWVAEKKGGQPAAVAEQAPAPVVQSAPPAELSKEELMTQGEQVYALNCVACHGAQGEGGVGNALKGSAIATGDVLGHIAIVLQGKPGTAMAAFGHLSDQELAAVITYERNAFGNNAGDVVQPADVQAAR